jgi:WD40 repeat protein
MKYEKRGRALQVYQTHKEAVRGISLSPTDLKFATCSDDSTVRVRVPPPFSCLCSPSSDRPLPASFFHFSGLDSFRIITSNLFPVALHDYRRWISLCTIFPFPILT